MRSKSPELMSEIKKYIEDYYLQNRQSPSTTKIAEAVGIARGTAYKYLVEMAEKNMIREHSIRYEVLSPENNRKCCSYGTKDTGKFPKRTSFEE